MVLKSGLPAAEVDAVDLRRPPRLVGLHFTSYLLPLRLSQGASDLFHALVNRADEARRRWLEYVYFNDPFHPAPLGHRMIASALLASVRASPQRLRRL